VLQFQGVQHDLDRIEVRLVCEKPLTPDQEDCLRKLVQRSLGHPFTLDFTYFRDRIPVGPNGKFEEFICRLDPP
jgi:phenylacetate-CoA ligase